MAGAIPGGTSRLVEADAGRFYKTSMSRDPNLSPPRADRFATTHWSVVVRAGRGRTPGAARALAALCENYWFPIYAFVRRAAHTADDAQDVTQALFAELLAKDVLAVADPQRDKFRSFLQGAIKNFLAKDHPTCAFPVAAR
jgi:RNA polymerase sigma-70 factor (ECF subfamily)